MKLRIRNPQGGSGDDFYLVTKNPSDGEIENALRNPIPRNGGCLVGDVVFYWGDREYTPHLKLYLGVPNSFAVLLDTYQKSWIRVNSGRSDLFLLCPDITPDTWWKLPNCAFVSYETAIQSVKSFAVLEERCAGLGFEETKEAVEELTRTEWQALGEENNFDIFEDRFD